jgi:hypothetical protein
MRQYGELEGDLEGPIQGFLSSMAKRHKITVVGGTIPLISRLGGPGRPVRPVRQRILII